MLLLVVMPERGFKPRSPEERASWQTLAETTRSGMRLIRQRPILLTLLGITAFIGLFSEGYDRLWTAHLLQDFRVPALGTLQPVAWLGVISGGSALLLMRARGQGTMVLVSEKMTLGETLPLEEVSTLD